jgi:hypothetical protein
MNDSFSPEQAPAGSIEHTPSPFFGSFSRKLFFIAYILLLFLVTLYLIYHNGKSIYDNGI